MALQQILDRTLKFNSDGEVKLDIGGYDYCIVQVISPSSAVSFETSNDSNAIEGASDGSAVSSTNYLTVQGVNLATNANVSSLSASGSVRFGYVGRYLRIFGTSATVTKLIIRLFKIG